MHIAEVRALSGPNPCDEASGVAIGTELEPLPPVTLERGRSD